MSSGSYLAIDLGAESGRLILGRLESSRLESGRTGIDVKAADRLSLQEVHRFSNGPVRLNDHLHWDVLRLWSEVLSGIRKAAQISKNRLASIGLDSWGVDFGLLDARDNLLGNPYHYRDSRTEGMLDAAFKIVSKEQIYRQTGVQFMEINSLYQLLSMKVSADPMLENARTFLNIPDLFNFWLTGRKASEFSIASTTQCFNLTRDQWAYDLIQILGLPGDIFQEIVRPGSVFGPMRLSLADELGLPAVTIATVGSHDTASAVAAIPAESDRFAFISSGTWSLVGSELDAPKIEERGLEFNFTNEGGVGGKYRFLKNISALWLVQECRRAWAAEGNEYTYDELTELARQARPFLALVDPGDPMFMSPGNIPQRIQQYCRLHGQPQPETRGEVVRITLESLALAYRQTLEQMAAVLGFRPEVIHIVGGGSRNVLLNQFTADATGLPVIAGPVEAASLGNLLLQAIALGDLSSVSEARDLVRRSFPLQRYEPGPRGPWDDRYAQWLQL